MKNKKDYNKQEQQPDHYSERIDTTAHSDAAIFEGERWQSQVHNIIYYILGVIEVLLVFRLMFKILGANAANGFVRMIYSLTRILIAPFWGIFNTGTAQSDGIQLIFEPAVIIAMIVYAVIAYGLSMLSKLTIK